MNERSLAVFEESPGSRRTLQFDAVEAFRSHLRGWDTDAVQLDAGPLRLGIDLVDCDDVRVSQLRVNRRMADTSWIEPGWVSFVVPMGEFTRKRWCGLDVGPGHLVVMVPGREYSSVLAPGWESFELSLRVELAAEIDPRFGRACLGDWAPENSVLELGTRCRSSLQRFSDAAFAGGPSSAAPSGVRGEAVATLAALLTTSVAGRRTASSRWSDLVGRAVERINLNRGPRRQGVAGLAATLGTTPRNLQYAFRSHFGVSPAQYELARRLGEARAHLMDEDGADRVSRIATDHDFNHFGRFSQQYRAMFGEAPSDTLRRRSRTPAGPRRSSQFG